MRPALPLATTAARLLAGAPHGLEREVFGVGKTCLVAAHGAHADTQRHVGEGAIDLAVLQRERRVDVVLKVEVRTLRAARQRRRQAFPEEVFTATPNAAKCLSTRPGGGLGDASFGNGADGDVMAGAHATSSTQRCGAGREEHVTTTKERASITHGRILWGIWRDVNGAGSVWSLRTEHRALLFPSREAPARRRISIRAPTPSRPRSRPLHEARIPVMPLRSPPSAPWPSACSRPHHENARLHHRVCDVVPAGLRRGLRRHRR